MTDILVWTCKACGARHPPTLCRSRDSDRCPQCKEPTPHEWVMLEGNHEVPETSKIDVLTEQ